uniref:ATG11 domain-containing protein n=1 Tax=Parastrongyloides trichosuri TaxID=131310 RepID=A0A0N5A3D8_PARTI
MVQLFYVNYAEIFYFNMPPNSSVHDLRLQIAESKRIDYQNQLLLLPTGENLDPNKMLSSYTSDIESLEMPLFLFNRKYNEENPETKEDSIRKNVDEPFIDIIGDIDTLLKNSKDSISLNGVAKLLQAIRQYEERVDEIIKQNYQYHELLDNAYKTFIIAILRSLDILLKKCDRNQERAKGLPSTISKGFEMLDKLPEKLELCKKIMIPTAVLKTSKLRSDQCSDAPISLYDWIDTKDPHTSLEQLENTTRCYFEHAKTVGLNDAKEDLSVAKAKINKNEIKEIKGLEKRMAALQEHIKKVQDILYELKRKIKGYENSVFPLGGGLKLSPDRLMILNDIKDLRKNVEDVTSIGRKIIDSKYELLNTILLRLKAVVEPVSEQAAEAHNKIAIFESTYENVVLKGDLIKQLNDAPLMYATATTETFRRIIFSKEFHEWLSALNKKVDAFVLEENDRRAKFNQNLKRHFLKQLFTGFDEYIPNFLCEVNKMDEGVPMLNICNLSELKRVVPEMEAVIKFETPNVQKRLSIESTKEEPTNFILSSSIIRPTGQLSEEITSATIPKFLSFTHFMSGDDNLEGFSRNNFLSPTSAFPSVMERHYEFELEKRTLTKTNSISISNSSHNICQFKFGSDDHFSSFDDLPGYSGYGMNELTEQSIMETTIQNPFSSLNNMTSTMVYPQGTTVVATYSENSQTDLDLFDMNLICDKLNEAYKTVSSMKNVFENVNEGIRKFKLNNDDCQNGYKYVISKIIDSFVKFEREMKSKVKELESNNNALKNDNKELEERIEEVKTSKDLEVEKLKEELARANVRIHIMECESSEKEEKFKALSEKYEKLSNEITMMEEVKNDYDSKNNSESEDSIDLKTSSIMIESSRNGNFTTPEIAFPVDVITREFNSLQVTVNSVGVQTRLHGGDIKAMISLQDIHEGCTVLIMWNPTYDAYLLSCSTNSLYFVKESSVERLGLSNTNASQRRHSMIATVSGSEKCQIRRENNRYKLPVGTKFYRVDVEILRWDTIKRGETP